MADADNASCAKNAAATLAHKLAATRSADYDFFRNHFLRGAHTALVFAAADRIGAHGQMTGALDQELQWAANTFKAVPEPGGCGRNETDNCMDTHAVTASGYGWIAAYRHRRGDAAAAQARDLARAYVDSTFLGACIRKIASTGGFCDAGPGDLGRDPATGRDSARTLSLNEGQQWPAYGFGLMTSIAAAALGWEGSMAPGSKYPFTPDQKAVAVGLFEEAQRVIDISVAPDTFKRKCVRPVTTPAGWVLTDSTADCAGLDPPPGEGKLKYTPQMYALYSFYGQRMGYTAPAGVYRSTLIDTDTFALGATQQGHFFGYGRYATYAELGHYWWKTRRDNMPLDRYQPRGYLDRIDGGRVAHGWACDQDTAAAPLRVELRVNGATVTGLANQPSESAVNTQCGGGTAHRFAVQLPAGTVGSLVTAKALDYTFGIVDLACATAGACAVPAPPTVDVAWVQPAEVSWGAPGTLTVAGHANGGTGGVKLEWRDVTFTTPSTFTPVEYVAPVDPSNGTWSNAIPSAYYCHTFEVKATYFGVTTAVFTYRGLTAGYCNQTASIIWIQPQTTAGWGTPGALIVAGEARGAPAGTTVSMWYRNVTLNGAYIKRTYDAPVDANGIWINDIPNANYSHQYAVYAKYDVTTVPVCTYQGTSSVTEC